MPLAAAHAFTWGARRAAPFSRSRRTCRNGSRVKEEEWAGGAAGTRPGACSARRAPAARARFRAAAACPCRSCPSPAASPPCPPPAACASCCASLRAARLGCCLRVRGSGGCCHGGRAARLPRGARQMPRCRCRRCRRRCWRAATGRLQLAAAGLQTKMGPGRELSRPVPRPRRVTARFCGWPGCRRPQPTLQGAELLLLALLLGEERGGVKAGELEPVLFGRKNASAAVGGRRAVAALVCHAAETVSCRGKSAELSAACSSIWRALPAQRRCYNSITLDPNQSSKGGLYAYNILIHIK